MKQSFLLLSALSFLVLGGTATGYAQQTYTPDLRFYIPGNDGDMGGQDVVVKKITQSQIPADIQQKVHQVLDRCVKNPPDPTALGYYAYYSSWNKKYNYPANYIIDFAALSDSQYVKQACSEPGGVCADGRCLLAGYVVGLTGQWERDIRFYPLSWGIGQAAQPGQTKTITFLQIATEDAKDGLCKENGGIVNQGRCLTNYLWAGRGMRLLPAK